MISRYEMLSSATAEISRLIAKISAAEMKRYGLRGTWARYLIALREYNSDITAAKLSVISARNKADVSRALSELEEHGLVKRVSGGNYRVRVTLTDKGREIADALHARAVDLIKFAGKDISDGERDILYRSLASLMKNLEEISKRHGTTVT